MRLHQQRCISGVYCVVLKVIARVEGLTNGLWVLREAGDTTR